MENNNYWIHRISGGRNASSLAHHLLLGNLKTGYGYLSIGWSDFSSDEYVTEALTNGIKSIDNHFREKGWGLPRGRWSLWRFLCEMKKGDIVIVPSPYAFHVVELVDDSILSNESIEPCLLMDGTGDRYSLEGKTIRNKNGEVVDIGFYRKVKIVEHHVGRKFAEGDLYSRLKILQTNAKITDLKNDVNNAIRAYHENKPVQLRESVLEELAPKVCKLIQSKLNNITFENLVERYLKSLGASDILKPATNESPTEQGDADRVAYFEKLNLVIIVQAKAHRDYTDQWAVEQVDGYGRNHDFDGYCIQKWVVSSCDDFNDDAKKKAKEFGVRLINGVEFARMLLDAGFSEIDV